MTDMGELAMVNSYTSRILTIICSVDRLIQELKIFLDQGLYLTSKRSKFADNSLMAGNPSG